MSRIAYFQAFSGASGDMFLGALVDAGWPAEELERHLAKLPLQGYKLDARKLVKGAIASTQVTFEVRDSGAERNLADILDILDRGALDGPVRRRAEGMFRRLAEVESRVHGMPVEEIHFHEVGAMDSILDVVGAAAGLEWLGAERITVSPMNAGGGVVSTLGGMIPVPGMATLALAQEVNAPLYSTSDEHEFLTTTGALILTSAATDFGPMPPMRVKAAGYGAGRRDFEIPNVLRVVLGEGADTAEQDVTTMIETNLDDLSPEVVAYVSELLFAAGALDVFTTPASMKKGRPGCILSVIARPADVEGLSETIFRETTTLGVRTYETLRRKLRREQTEVDTPWGRVGVKLSYLGGRLRDASPEFEDCRSVALIAGVPIRDVLEAASQAGRALAAGRMPFGEVGRAAEKGG